MADKHNHLLELVMFDIAYVISNCDYEYSSDEKKYLNVILDRYSDDDKELLKLRTQFLDSICLLYTSPSPRDLSTSRMPSSA